MYSASQNRAQAQSGINAAGANAASANELQRAMADRQYTLSTSGQTDERGNQLIYDPTSNTWKTLLSPEGKALLARSDAINRMHDVDTLGRGASERSANYQRRLAEGSTAAPLLDAIRYGYGAPTKEGVVGANKVAAATNASEGADLARTGYTGAALRTGFGYTPLQQTLASVDRSAVSGQRGALASAEASGGDDYNTKLANFIGSKLSPYNTLATRASNTENVPFAPYDSGMASASLNRAIRAPTGTYNPNAGAVGTAANKNLIDAIGKMPGDETGRAVGTVANSLLEYFKKQQGGGSGFTTNSDMRLTDAEIKDWSNYNTPGYKTVF
jgi:hypothetical protein